MNKLEGSLYVFWMILKYLPQREVALLAMVSKSFRQAIYHTDNPLWRQIELYTNTYNYVYWKSYILWISNIMHRIQPIAIEISLTLSRISDENLTEKELENQMEQDFQQLYQAIRDAKENKSFKLYIDQHPLRQKVLINFLFCLTKHWESLEKLRISQVSLEGKHIELISTLKNLSSLDIGYCVCEGDAPFNKIGGGLIQFCCQDCSNIQSKQIIEVLINNPHITSLSFCAEEFKGTENCDIISKVGCIKKLRVCHAHTVNGVFFDVLQGHSEYLEKLQISKITEATSSDIKILLSKPLPKLTVLCLEESENLDSFNVERIAENCPKLIELSLQWSIHIENDGIKAILAKLLNLCSLNLAGLKRLNNEPFEYAISLPKSGCQHLKKLDLTQCNFVQESVLKKLISKFPQMIITNYYGETNEFWND